MLLSKSSSLGFGSRRATRTSSELPELELQDPREHPVVHRRAEHRARQQLVEHPHRRATPTRTRAATRSARSSRWPTSSRAARCTRRSASSRSRRTTSCGTARSSSRTTSDVHRGQHSLTFGGSAERYESENVFFPGSQSIYVYNSLADFYADSNDYLANPNRTTSPITLRRFQVRWMNIPGSTSRCSRSRCGRRARYIQDEWRPRHEPDGDDGPADGRAGVRRHGVRQRERRRARVPRRQRQPGPVPSGQAAGHEAALVAAHRLQLGPRAERSRHSSAAARASSRDGRPTCGSRTRSATPACSPGSSRSTTRATRPFHPDPNHYKPTNVTGAPASSYELAFTDRGLQVPAGVAHEPGDRSAAAVGSGRHGRGARTARTSTASRTSTRTCRRPMPVRRRRQSAALDGQRARIHATWPARSCCRTRTPGRPGTSRARSNALFQDGLWVKARTATAARRNEIDPGSIAIGSWTGNPHRGDPNNPGMGYTLARPPDVHRRDLQQEVVELRRDDVLDVLRRHRRAAARATGSPAT